ncbi:AAA family ATPase [Bosea thiooxidans]
MSDAQSETFDEGFDEVPPPARLTLRGKFLGGYLRPRERLSRLMLWRACTARLRRDVMRRRSIVVVIEAPSQDWADSIFDAVRSFFPNAQFLTKEGGRKPKNLAAQEVVLTTAMACSQSVVVMTSDGLDGIHDAIIASMDHHLEVEYPDRRMIAATIRSTFGSRYTPRLPDGIGIRAPAGALLAAIREQENAGRATVRLATLDRRLREIPALKLKAGPTLDELSGYGQARDWGLQLARDLEAYRGGEIGWSEISSAGLLHGPPGTGKTYFASALARSCRVPFFSTSIGKLFNDTTGYLDGFIKGLTQTFTEARKAAPSLLFIDELDALPDRAKLSGRNRDWWTTVVNYFLKLLDDHREGVIVLGATNMLDRLDSAILRAGRLEKHFKIELPDEDAIATMLRHHLADRLPATDLSAIARLARGSTGADIALLVKTVVATARHEGRELLVDDLINHLVRDELKSEQLRRISIHEAGHAVVAHVLGRKVQHLTTLRRGDNLGSANIEPPGLLATRSHLEDQVMINLAGRNAEILLLGEASDGAGIDLQRATMFASAIQASFGLGSSLVHRSELMATPGLLEDPQFRDLIEAELRILDARCIVLLTTHQEKLKAVAEALQTRRALSAEEFLRIASP